MNRLFFESYVRRKRRPMCEGCIRGMHQVCESERCPCVCNDSDFRFARKPRQLDEEQDRIVAQVIAVRPELAELFSL